MELLKEEKASYGAVQWSMGETKLPNAFEKFPSTVCSSFHIDDLSTDEQDFSASALLTFGAR